MINNKFLKHTCERGSLMIEAIAMLGLISMISPMLFRQTSERQNELADIAVANQTRVLTQSVNDFIRSHQTELVGGLVADGSSKEFYLYQCIDKTNGNVVNYAGANPDHICIVDNLPRGIVVDPATTTSAPNSLIKEYKVSVRNDGNKLTGMLVGVGSIGTSGSDGLPRLRAARIASMIGAQGGFSVDDGGNLVISGSQGTWEIDNMNQFFDTTTFDPGEGSIFSTTSFEPTQEYTDFLHREFNGDVLLNTMQTTMFFDPGISIEMDGGSITSANTGGIIRFGDPTTGAGFSLNSAAGTILASDNITSRIGNIEAVAGDVIAGNDMDAGGAITAAGDIESSGGSVIADLDLIAGRDLDVTGNAKVGGFLNVIGNIDGDDITAYGDLDVAGTGNIDGSLTVGGDGDIAGKLDVHGVLNALGGIDITGNVTADNVYARHNVEADEDVVAGRHVIAETGDIVAYVGDIIADDGDVQAKWDVISTDGDFLAKTGDIISELGSVIADLDVISNGGDIIAKDGEIISELGGVTADLDIISKNGHIIAETGNVVAETGHIISELGNVEAELDVIAHQNVLSDGDVRAANNIGVYFDIADETTPLIEMTTRVDGANEYGVLSAYANGTEYINIDGSGIVKVGSDWDPLEMWDFSNKDDSAPPNKGLLTSNYIQSEEMYTNKAYLESVESENIALVQLDGSGEPVLDGTSPVYTGFIEGQSFMYENDDGAVERILNLTLDDVFNEISFIRDQVETAIHTEGHSIYLDHTGDGNLAAVIGSYPTSNAAVHGRGVLLYDEVGLEKIVLDSITGDMINFGGNFYMADDNGTTLVEILNQSNAGVAVLRYLDDYGSLLTTTRLAPDEISGYNGSIDTANMRWKMYLDNDYSGTFEMVSGINTNTNIEINARQYFDTELIEDYEITINGSVGTSRLNSDALVLARNSTSRSISADLLDGFSISNDTDEVFKVDMNGDVYMDGCLRDMGGNIIQVDVNGVLTDLCAY